MARTRNKGRGKTSGKRQPAAQSHTSGKPTTSKPEAVSKETASDPKDPQDPEKSPEDKGKNDPAWYSRDPRLIIDAASLPFSNPYGAVFDFRSNNPNNVVGNFHLKTDSMDTYARSTPGIMVFKMLPSVGESSDRLSPINVAATAIYSQVRYVNNGRKNYDPADLMLYIAAVADLYSYVNWMRRIYGQVFIYSQSNRYLGKALLRAQGINPEDVIRNLANLRYWINVFTNKISSYAVPAEIEFFKKRAFQFGSYYIEHEGESIKDQLYMYSPDAFYRFALDSAKKGMLELIPATGTATGMTVSDLQAIGERLLDNIFADEDFGLISGDVMKAFNGQILQLEALPEDYVLPPIHDKGVLTQMENTTVTPAAWHDPATTAHEGPIYQIDVGESSQVDCYSGNVYQKMDGNLVMHYFMVQPTEGSTINGTNRLYAGLDKVLNIHEAVADPAMVVEAIQNMVGVIPRGKEVTKIASSVTPADEWSTITTGASFCTSVYFYSLRRDGELDTAEFRQMLNEPTVIQIRDTDLKSRTFKYAPALFWINRTGTQIEGIRLVSNVDTYTFIDNEQIARLQEVSMLSLLYVPGVAKFANALS